MARTVALLPTGFVVASEAPSLFGGPPRTKLETMPRWARLASDSAGFSLSATPPTAAEIATDVVRLVFAPAVDGNPRTAARR